MAKLRFRISKRPTGPYREFTDDLSEEEITELRNDPMGMISFIKRRDKRAIGCTIMMWELVPSWELVPTAA